MMQIYNSAMSPFGARTVIATRAKGITIEAPTLPPAWRTSPEIKAMNPIVKIPILQADGMTLPESETILRYLEDRFPDPTLLPATAAQRAQMNLLIRITDLYVMAPVIRLFGHLDPAARDARVVDSEVGYWQSGLASLAHFLPVTLERPATGLTLADCVLAPSLHLCGSISGVLGLGDLLAPHKVITDYYEQVQQHPIVGPVLADLTKAQSGH